MNSHPVSRRNMLRGTAAGAASLWLRLDPLGAETAMERRQASGLKLSCSSLAFSDMEWDVALAEIKKLGFRYAELAMCEGVAHQSPSTLIDPEGHGKRINAACARLEVEPIAIHANFALGDPKQFPGLTVPDPAARKTILAHFERVVACARTAEIPLINVLPGNFIENVSRETCLKNAVDMLTQMHAMAARRGLILSFKNHARSVGEQVNDAWEILTAVPGLRLDYDQSGVVYNSISVEETSRLMKHVAHIGVRNAKPGDFNLPIEDGMLDYPIKSFLDVFRQEKVNAFVAVDYFEPIKRDNIPRLKAILEREGISAS